MSGKILSILRRRRLLLDPFMGPHITHSVKMGPVFYRNARGSNIADQDAMFLNLDFGRGGYRSVDLATGHQRPG